MPAGPPCQQAPPASKLPRELWLLRCWREAPLAWGGACAPLHRCSPRPLPAPVAQEARALVGWAAAVLRELDVEATKKAVVKLLECQVGSGVCC